MMGGVWGGGGCVGCVCARGRLPGAAGRAALRRAGTSRGRGNHAAHHDPPRDTRKPTTPKPPATHIDRRKEALRDSSQMLEPVEVPKPTTFEKAIAILESDEVEPDPGAPSCMQYKLRPSEIAAIIQERHANPPPPWGKKISLAKAYVGPEKCLALGHKLILNRTVTFLDLSMCNLCEAAAPEFFSCVQRNKVLRHLNVTGNAIGDAGAVAAAPCVLQLESLHLGSNGITDVGAVAIASALASSSKIKALNLRSNRITQYGIYKTLMALEDVSSQLPEEVLSAVKQKECGAGDATAKVTLMSTQSSVSDSLTPTNGSGTDAVHSARRGGSNNGGGDPPTDAVTASETPNRDRVLTESQPSLLSAGTLDAPAAPQSSQPVEENKESVFNETLNVLWIDNNIEIPSEMLAIVTTIMAKRFPPPPPKSSKRKGKKDNPSATKK